MSASWSKLHLHTNLIILSQKNPQAIWLRHSIVFHSVLPSISTSWCYFKWGSHLIWQNISHGSLSPLAKIYGERERERESPIVYNYLKLEQSIDLNIFPRVAGNSSIWSIARGCYIILRDYLIQRSCCFVSNCENIKSWMWKFYPYFLWFSTHTK